jgi:hypothetical protein
VPITGRDAGTRVSEFSGTTARPVIVSLNDENTITLRLSPCGGPCGSMRRIPSAILVSFLDEIARLWLSAVNHGLSEGQQFAQQRQVGADVLFQLGQVVPVS